MKLKSLIATLFGVMLLIGTASAEAGWHTDWDKAQAESTETGRPILIDFTGSDWCGWCVRLKEEVFDTSEFKTWASKNVVLLEIDFPQEKPQPEETKQKNQALARKYEVGGFPTILFTNPDGSVLGTYGYDEGGPAKWTKKAETFLP